MRRALAVTTLACALACTTARAEPPASSTKQARIAYIAGLLDAIAATDQTSLTNTSNYIYAIERNKCQAPDEALHVGCLLEAATRNCLQSAGALRDQCRRASDVIVTNRLSEKAFVPENVRYEIMETHRDYRTAFARELHRRYAILVAEFSMSQLFPGSAADNAALAAGLEAYCREVAGTRELAWQSCVAAVVWFIGAGGRTVKP